MSFSMTGIGSISLGSPNLDDNYALDKNSIFRKTRQGTLKVFKDNNWPTVETFRYTFNIKTSTELSNLETFFNNNLGLTVTFTDHYNVSRTGYIISSNFNPAQIHNCKYELTLEIITSQQIKIYPNEEYCD